MKSFYLRQKSEIRFGRRTFDTAAMDDLCVDLELVEDVGNSLEGLMKDTETFFKFHDMRHFLGSMSQGYSLAGKLLLFGNGGVKKKVTQSEQERVGYVTEKCITYKNLSSLSDHILLYGSAGTGKTTLVAKIAYHWAKNIEIQTDCFSTEAPGSMHSMKLVFVLDIRNLKSNQTLAGAIQNQLLPCAAEDDINQVLRSLQQKCLVIFDGFDEMPKTLEDHALESSELHNVCIVVTSRPHLIDAFCMKYKKYTLVKVAGFSEETVLNYIQRYYDRAGKPVLASSLIGKVKENPLIQALSSFPVLLVMICLLWENAQNRDIAFHSMTSLYREAISKYLNKPFENKGQEEHKNCTFEIALVSLGKTALIELFKRQIQISTDKFHPDALKLAIDMGLVIQSEGKLVDDASVSFIHKTFQEYCAALYLSNLFRRDIEKFKKWVRIIMSINAIEEMEHVLRFTCGLNSKAVNAILSGILQVDEGFWNKEYYWNLIPILLIYEAELSHGSKLEFHTKLQASIPSEFKICVVSNDILAAFLHFTSGIQRFSRQTWLNQITSFTCHHGFSNKSSVIQVMGSMPLLETAEVKIVGTWDGSCNASGILKFVKLIQFTLSVTNKLYVDSLFVFLNYMPVLARMMLGFGQLEDARTCNVISQSQTLKTVDLIGDDLHETDVSSLVSLLYRMPSLTKASVLNVQFSNELNFKVPLAHLGNSLKELKVSGLSLSEMCSSLNVAPLVSFISSMSVLTKLSLHRIKLVGECEGDLVFSKSLTKLCLSEEAPYILPQKMTSLITFLRCIPELKQVSLTNIQLTGELGMDPVVFRTSIEHLTIATTPSAVTAAATAKSDATDQRFAAPDNTCTDNSGATTDSHLSSSNRNLVAPKNSCSDHSAVTASSDSREGDQSLVVSAATVSADVSGSDHSLVSPDNCIANDVSSFGNPGRSIPGEKNTLIRIITNMATLNSILSDIGYNVWFVSIASLAPIISILVSHGQHVLPQLITNWDAIMSVLDDEEDGISHLLTNSVTILESFMEEIRVSPDSSTIFEQMTRFQRVTVFAFDERFEVNTNSELIAILDECYSTISSDINLIQLLKIMDKILNSAIAAVFGGGVMNRKNTISAVKDMLNKRYSGDLKMVVSTLSGALNAGGKDMVSTIKLVIKAFKIYQTFDIHGRGDHIADAINNSSCHEDDQMFTVCMTSEILHFMRYMPKLKTMVLQDIHLTGLGSECEAHPSLTTDSLREFWILSHDYHTVFNVSDICLLNILKYMPSVEKVVLQNVHMTGDMCSNSVYLSESLKQFVMIRPADDDCSVNMVKLVKLLQYMPGLTTIELQSISLTHASSDANLVLRDSVKELFVTSNLPGSIFKVNITSILSFIGHMPGLTKVILADVQLSQFDDELPINLVRETSSVRELWVRSRTSGKLVNANGTTLINVLRCMPSVEKVVFQNVQLAGDLCSNPVPSSESLKQFVMIGNTDDDCSIDMVKLVKLLQCMPGLTTVELQSICLTHASSDANLVLRESVKILLVSSHLPGSIFKVNVASILSFIGHMPGLTRVILLDVQLSQFDDELPINLVRETSSVRELGVLSRASGKLVNANETNLLKLLLCIPSVEIVVLLNVHLAGDLCSKPVSLSESLKHFVMIRTTDEDCSVNMSKLLKVLQCMPGLTTVELQSICLTHASSDSNIILRESVKILLVSSHLPGSIFKVNVASILSFIGHMPGLTKVILLDIQLSQFDDEFPINLMRETSSVRELWIQSRASGNMVNVNETTLLHVLRCMPSVEKVVLQNVQLAGDLCSNSVPSSESLKQMVMIGNTNDGCSVDMVKLVKLLQCLPGLTTVELQSICLTHTSSDENLVLRESVKLLLVSSHLPGSIFKVNMASILNFVGHMSGLTKVTFVDIQLSQFDDELPINLVRETSSVRELWIQSRASGNIVNANETTLLNVLRCMPSVEKVVLQNVQLAGDLCSNPVPSSESLKQMVMIGNTDDGCSVDRVKLVKLLQCLPGLTTVELQSICLTHASSDENLVLQESVKMLMVSSHLPGSIFKVNMASILNLVGYMPGLTKVRFIDVQLSQFDDELPINLVRETSSVRELWIQSRASGNLVNANGITLLNVLRCMPSVETVVLQNVQLAGDLCSNPVPSNESLKQFIMIGNTDDGCSVDMVKLVKLLQCMPGLTRVELQSICLTHASSDANLVLRESVKLLLVSSHLPGSIFKVTMPSILNFIRHMSGLTKVTFVDIQLSQFDDELPINLGRETSSVRELWIQSRASGNMVNANETTLLNVLRCMPSVEKVVLQNVQLAGDLCSNPVPSSESLKQMVMIGNTDDGCSVDMVKLVKLLQCLPGLTTVELQSICLTHASSDENLVLQESVKMLMVSSHLPGSIFKVNMASILNFVGYMPGLTKVRFIDVQLSQFDDELPINLVIETSSVRELWIQSRASGNLVNANGITLLNVLRCMPSVETVVLQNVQLAGDLCSNPVPSNESLKQFIMIGNTNDGCSVDMVKLVKLLQCMPGLTTVGLQSICLTHASSDANLVLRESVKILLVSSHLPGSIFKVNMASILNFIRHMSGLTKVTFVDIQLSQFDDELPINLVRETSSVRELWIQSRASGNMVNANETTLLNVLRCMPSVEKVVLQNVQLAGDLCSNPVPSSESLKQMVMIGNTDDGCSVDMVKLVKLLQCLPGLTTVELQSICLTHASSDENLVLQESVKMLMVSSHLPGSIFKVNMASILNFVGYMLGLTKVRFIDVQLSQFDDELPINLVRETSSVRELWIQSRASGNLVNANGITLVNVLRCMPSVETVVLQNVQLAGDLCSNPVPSNESLKQFIMIGNTDDGCSVDMVKLVKLLQCMPGLTTVGLQSICLTHASSDANLVLRESVKLLLVSSHLPGSIFKVNMASILNFVGHMSGLTKVTFVDIQLSQFDDELPINLVRETSSVRELWIQSRASGNMVNANETTLLNVLRCMPSVEKVVLQNVQLAGDLCSNPVPSSESLKQMVMIGNTDDGCSVDMVKLVKLLQCLPGLTTVELQSICLTHASSDENLVLQESVKMLMVSSHLPGSIFKVNMASILNFVGYMPGLTKVRFIDVQLSQFDDELPINLVRETSSVRELWIQSRASGNLVNANGITLVNVLRCMPSVETVVLQNVQLAGDLCSNPVPSNESLKQFIMIGNTDDGCSVDMVKLVKLLQCMPGLTRVELQSICLTHASSDANLVLRESVKLLLVSSHLPGSIFKVNMASILNFVGHMSGLTKVTFVDIQLSQFDDELPINLVRETSSVRELWIQSRASGNIVNANETTLLNVLRCMPSVEKVVLQNVQLAGDLCSNPVPSSESLKQMVMIGNTDDGCSVDMVKLVKLLQCLPGLTTVELQSICLTHASSDGNLVLQESVKMLMVSSHLPGSIFKVNMASILNFVGYMPGLTKVRFIDVQLSQFDDELPINLVRETSSVRELWIQSRASGNLVNANGITLLNVLRCMPSVETVVLQNVQLAGDLCSNPVPSSESLKQFVMIGNTDDGCSVDMVKLVKLLQCMHGLRRVELQSICLTHASSDANLVLRESVKLLLVSSHLPGSIFKVTMASILNFIRHMSGLTKVTFVDIQLSQFDDELPINLVRETSSVRELWIQSRASGNMVNANETTLLNVLRCMPSVEKVVLQNVQLAGDLCSNSVPSSESLKQFVMIGNTDDDYSVDVVKLVKLLQCMPGLTTVELQSICLIHASSDANLVLRESVKLLLVSSHLPGSIFKVNMTSILNFVGYMPGLSEVMFRDVQLSQFEDELPINLVRETSSVRELWVLSRASGKLVNANGTTLLNFLQCMPSVEKAVLQNVCLTGDICSNHVCLSESLKHFVMKGSTDNDCSVNMVMFLKLLNCMPGLTTVEIQSINFTHTLGDGHLVLRDSVKYLLVSSNPPGSIFKVNVTNILSFIGCMPGLIKVIFEDIQISKFDYELPANCVRKTASVKELRIQSRASGYMFDLVHLVELLRCMPSFTEVTLQSVILTGEISDKNIDVSDALKDFSVTSLTSETTFRVNLIHVLSLIKNVSGLSVVTFENINLRPCRCMHGFTGVLLQINNQTSRRTPPTIYCLHGEYKQPHPTHLRRNVYRQHEQFRTVPIYDIRNMQR